MKRRVPSAQLGAEDTPSTKQLFFSGALGLDQGKPALNTGFCTVANEPVGQQCKSKLKSGRAWGSSRSSGSRSG